MNLKCNSIANHKTIGRKFKLRQSSIRKLLSSAHSNALSFHNSTIKFEFSSQSDATFNNIITLKKKRREIDTFRNGNNSNGSAQHLSHSPFIEHEQPR